MQCQIKCQLWKTWLLITHVQMERVVAFSTHQSVSLKKGPLITVSQGLAGGLHFKYLKHYFKYVDAIKVCLPQAEH